MGLRCAYEAAPSSNWYPARMKIELAESTPTSILTIASDDPTDEARAEVAIGRLKEQLPVGAFDPNRIGITHSPGGGFTAQINFPYEYVAAVKAWRDLEGL